MLSPSAEPESRLAAFNGALQRLRPHLTGQDAELAAELLSQTLATELLHDRDLLGVTGTQGAGKTTLMREVYGEQVEGWLADNAGRGEKLPVLITEESGRVQTEACLYELADKGAALTALRARVVDKPEWEGALRGALPAVVLAELRVAPNVFDGARRGFLLLPGYEAVHEQNARFQKRMRRALAACNGFVIVTSRSRLAQ